jgi:hypothetical protein
MRFIVNEERKIIFGWSPKCGCTHVKKLIFYLENYRVDYVHNVKMDTNFLPRDLENYIIIIITRNPYKRLVSGFLDKYRLNGQFRHLWKIEKPLTISNFIDELLNNNFEAINCHHFIQQTKEFFDEKILKHDKLIIYDVGKIDYEYIGMLFGKVVPDEIINFRGDHTTSYADSVNIPVYDLEIDSYYECKPQLENFYSEELKEKVYSFYKSDFDFLESKGFKYQCQNDNDLEIDNSIAKFNIKTYKTALRKKYNSAISGTLS